MIATALQGLAMTAPRSNVPYYDAIKGPSLTIYFYLLHEVLNPRDFVSVKSEAIAVRLNLHRNTVSTALAELCEKGFLERGEVSRQSEQRTYRLVYERMP